MQKAIEIGQVRPSVLSNVERTVKNWMESKSEFFSQLCGEEFSNGEVVAAHVVCAGLLLLSMIGGVLWP